MNMGKQWYCILNCTRLLAYSLKEKCSPQVGNGIPVLMIKFCLEAYFSVLGFFCEPEKSSYSEGPRTFLRPEKISPNSIHKVVKCRFKAKTSCYYSVHTLLSSRLLSKNLKTKI